MLGKTYSQANGVLLAAIAAGVLRVQPGNADTFTVINVIAANLRDDTPIMDSEELCVGPHP